MKKKILLMFSLLLATAAHADGVIVSIKPLHSLIQGVIGDTGEAQLLVDKQSPHDFSLKPSQHAALQDADLIFYIDDDFELFLRRSLSASSARHFAATEMKDVTLLPYDDHEDEHGHGHKDHDEHGHAHDHAHGGIDLHLWLSADNAEKIVAAAAAALAETYPQHRAAYADNAAALTQRLRRLDADLTTELTSLKGVPYMTFHDAYRYYERRYGLNNRGVVAINPSITPSGARLTAVRRQLRNDNVVCLFAEPQFPRRVVETIARDSGVKVGVIDPLGADLTAGAELYFQLMHGIAATLRRCLL